MHSRDGCFKCFALGFLLVSSLPRWIGDTIPGLLEGFSQYARFLERVRFISREYRDCTGNATIKVPRMRRTLPTVKEPTKDSSLFWSAFCVAVVGLVLLAFAREDQSDRYVLEGDVVSVHGHQATVQANVTLIASSLKKGTHVVQETFWGGDAFVGVQNGT